MKNPANDWLNGKISMGKMIQLIPDKRDLVGAIMNAMDERRQAMRAVLEKDIDRADRDFGNAQSKLDAVAEASRKRALTECNTLFQFHIGSALDNTSAGK